MRSGFRPAAVLVLALGAGCAPREAFFRPADRRAVGRDGYVGAAYRVPPGGNREAEAVAALSPLVRRRVKVDEEKKDFWKLAAVIEFRNKRRRSITFLPGSVKLSSPEWSEQAPELLTRTGGSQPVKGEVEIRHWHRASLQAHWRLPAGKKAPKGPLVLCWAYRYAGKTYSQKTVMKPTGDKLAHRSLVGDPTGMVTDVDYHSSSGVPFLMNIPFVGALFRNSTTVRSRTVRSFDTGIKARGTWWPLEGTPETEFRVPSSGFRGGL